MGTPFLKHKLHGIKRAKSISIILRMEAASLEKLNERKNVATDLPLDVEVSEKVGCRMPVRMYSRSNMNIWGTHCMDRERKEIDQFYRVGSFGSIKKKKICNKVGC